MIFGWSFRLHLVSIQSCCRYVQAGCSTLARLCEEVSWRTSLMSSSLFFQLCPTCLIHLIWMIFKMGGRCPYSCYFVKCCFQDLFNIALSILVQFPSSFFSIRFVSVHVVHPYSSMDMTTPWKKSRFIL